MRIKSKPFHLSSRLKVILTSSNKMLAPIKRKYTIACVCIWVCVVLVVEKGCIYVAIWPNIRAKLSLCKMKTQWSSNKKLAIWDFFHNKWISEPASYQEIICLLNCAMFPVDNLRTNNGKILNYQRLLELEGSQVIISSSSC